MKAKTSVLKSFCLAASVIIWCALNLPAQTPPAISRQPTSQTNLAGTNVTFTVAVSGTGPFTYQWQFNGANLPNNIVTNVAGIGVFGYSGDGGPATNAELNSPYGVALDAVGNIFIADRNNQRIRERTFTAPLPRWRAGVPAVTAARPPCFPKLYLRHGLGCPGNLYIADEGNNRIRKVDTNGIITTAVGNGVTVQVFSFNWQAV